MPERDGAGSFVTPPAARFEMLPNVLLPTGKVLLELKHSAAAGSELIPHWHLDGAFLTLPQQIGQTQPVV